MMKKNDTAVTLSAVGMRIPRHDTRHTHRCGLLAEAKCGSGGGRMYGCRGGKGTCCRGWPTSCTWSAPHSETL